MTHFSKLRKPFGKSKEDSYFALSPAELQKIPHTFSVESCGVFSSFLSRLKGLNGALHSAIIRAWYIPWSFINTHLL